LQVISQRNTRAQLIAELPHAKSSPDGNVYLNDATAALFPAVVKATMDGTASEPKQEQ
jgi:cytochrome o ubiquinol oxidase subunit 2